MRKTIIKLLVFAILLLGLVKLNLEVFRSDFPYLFVVSALISIIVIIYLPYKQIFKN